jgi:general L-amino acid transport system permease protein
VQDLLSEEVALNRNLRDALLQIAFVGCMACLVLGFIIEAYFNLKAQGITSGFDFLDRPIGWDMGFAFLPSGISDPYWYALFLATMNTVVIGYIAMALATIVGAVIAVMRISGNAVLNVVAIAYVEAIRNVPPIVQILAWYALISAFPPPRHAIGLAGGAMISARGLHIPAPNVPGQAIALACLVAVCAFFLMIWIGFGKRFMFTSNARKLQQLLCVGTVGALIAAVIIALFHSQGTPLISYPSLQGLNIQGGRTVPPEVATILVGVTVFGSAFAAEIIRGGFLSVDPSKLEAGKALGLSQWAIFSRIHVPITVKNIMPMMTNLYVWLLKATALGVVVGFPDIYSVIVAAIVQSGHVVEFVLILAAVFWFVNTSFTLMMNRFALRMRLAEARS